MKKQTNKIRQISIMPFLSPSNVYISVMFFFFLVRSNQFYVL